MSETAYRPRVVLDCNVLVQAVSNAVGPAGRCLQLLEQGVFEAFVSHVVLNELRTVLNYPTVRQKLPDLNNHQIEAFAQRLAFRATFVRHVPHIFDYPRAQQDEAYIDLAAAADAHYLVSRDKDLLDLATDHSIVGKQFRQRFPRLQVVNPVLFLNALDAAEKSKS